MKPNDRLLGAWNTFTAYVLAPITMLSVVLGWSETVQLALTFLMLVATSVPALALSRARRRR